MQTLDLIHLDDRSDEYKFKHALVRDALYQSILTERRQELHSKIAEETERRSGNRPAEVAEVLAHHYRQTNNTTKAFVYLSMAGGRSLGVYSLEEAENYFAAALAVLDNDPECASDDQVAEFLALYVRLLQLAYRFKVLIEVVGRYLARVDRIGDDLNAVAIRVHYFEALIMNGRYREAAPTQQNSLSIADGLGVSISRLYVVVARLIVSAFIAPMPLHEFESVKREALTFPFETTDAYIPTGIRSLFGWQELSRGRLNEARNFARETMQLGQSLNDPRSTGFGLLLLSWIALVSGSIAERDAALCLQLEHKPTWQHCESAAPTSSCLAHRRRTASSSGSLAMLAAMRLASSGMISIQERTVRTEPSFGLRPLRSSSEPDRCTGSLFAAPRFYTRHKKVKGHP